MSTCWSYAENELVSFEPDKISFKPTGSFYKDIASYCELVKMKVHPCFREPKEEDNPLLQAALVKESLQKLEESKEGQDNNKLPSKELEVLQVYTKRVDKNSLYALRAVLPSSKIHTLKFANNGFTLANFELLVDCIAASPVSRLFFDWNPLPKKPPAEAQSEPTPFAKLLANPKLEFLYLRSDEIDDEAMEAICEKLKTSKIKCLDLSLNTFRQNSIKLIVEALKENFTLEYLGIAGLELNIADLKPLLDEIGKFKLTPEEAAELQQKIKERDMIVEKNKKARGKKEEPVPKVPNMIQDDQGNAFVLKKEHFKHLNIGLNNLDDAAVEELDKLLARTPAAFNLTMASRLLSKEAAKTLSMKYGERVIL